MNIILNNLKQGINTNKIIENPLIIGLYNLCLDTINNPNYLDFILND